MTAPSTHDDTPPTAITLDAAALSRLRELDPDGRAGVMQRVMRTFDTSLTQTLGALALAGQRGDAIELRHLAHTLKSSSASVGALELSQACARLEVLARDNRAMDIPAVLAELLGAGAMAQHAVRVLMRG